MAKVKVTTNKNIESATVTETEFCLENSNSKPTKAIPISTLLVYD